MQENGFSLLVVCSTGEVAVLRFYGCRIKDSHTSRLSADALVGTPGRGISADDFRHS